MTRKPTIFLSYRRQASADLARYIHHRLSDLDYDVFLDVEDITGGRFSAVIEREIAARDCFVPILTPDTLASTWVCREIATAMAQHKPIVPLVSHNFSFSEPLPDEIADLAKYDAIRFDHEYANAAFERLVKAITSSQAPRRSIPSYIVMLAVPALLILVLITALYWPNLFSSNTEKTSDKAIQTTATATVLSTSIHRSPSPSMPVPTGTAVPTNTMTLTSATSIGVTAPTAYTTTPASSQTPIFPCDAQVSPDNPSRVLTIIREMPDSNAATVRSIQRGETIQVLRQYLEGERLIWYRIADSSGAYLGWIPADYVVLSSACFDK